MIRLPQRISGWVLMVIMGLAIACESGRFLQTNSASWNTWLNQYVDVDLTKVPLSELSRHAPFQELNLVLTGVDGESLVSLSIEHVPRRRALDMLAVKYGLALTVGSVEGQPKRILVTNREASRELKPLP